jgi:hypothetical protein
MQIQAKSFQFSRALVIAFLIAGAAFALYSQLSPSFTHPNIRPAAFVDRLAVPYNSVALDPLTISMEVDNFLVFQNFQVVPAAFTLKESYFFGLLVLLASITGLAAFSQFKKFPFLGAGVGWILLLTFCNVNGLNIGGLSANLPLLILLLATLVPTLSFHIWGSLAPFWMRWMGIGLPVASAIFTLIQLSPIPNPALYLAEQSLVLALGMSLAWIFWQGHGILSGLLVLISKTNKGLATNITWQFAGLSFLYLLLLFFMLLELKGEANLPFPTFSPLFLLFPLGLLGWGSIKEKLSQSENLAAQPATLQLLYTLGFTIALWTVWKLTVAFNQPGEELFKHLLVYSQLGFSLFFLIYTGINFFPVMRQGRAVHDILFKPYILPYYHLRIGGLITLLVVTTYLEAVIATQANSMTTNILGDYFYQTEQKLSASILYENSWDRYRYNPKAKTLAAQLLFDLKQPTLAKEQLEESFAEAPQVDNILLLCERLQRENKLFEAVYYLEDGLKRFPSNPYLTQNLALLYTLVQRQEEALLLLKDSPKDSPSAASNWLALQVKFGLTPEFTSSPNDLVGLINQVAARRKSGVPIPAEKLTQLEALLQKETSPMLIQAGYRNLLSSPNGEDPSSDLALMDSLAKQEAFLDYSMQLQETAVLRSLGAGRISDAVKNLNGLAFRNPGDAAYYLNLTGLIQAQQLDFEKAAKDFAFSKAKGFNAQKEIHFAALAWAADSVAQPTAEGRESPQELLAVWGNFNEQLPQVLFSQWKTLPAGQLKTSLASKLLSHKGHDLSADQLKDLGAVLSGNVDREADLIAFLSQPDWSNPNALRSFTQFLGVPEVLNANPYFTPLILSAAAQAKDPLAAYELLNSASEFNKDPLLWIKKIQAARALGLDNYAIEAQEELSQWLSQEEIEKLLGANY